MPTMTLQASDWNSATNYVQGDVVHHVGSSPSQTGYFLCLVGQPAGSPSPNGSFDWTPINAQCSQAPGGRLAILNAGVNGDPLFEGAASGNPAELCYYSMAHACIPFWNTTRHIMDIGINANAASISMQNQALYNTNSYYDIFMQPVTGVANTLTPIQWSSATTRGFSHEYRDGVLVHSQNLRTYLGTVYLSNVNGTNYIFDTPDRRHIYNHYNRVPRRLSRNDSASTWLYQGLAPRIANNNSANKIEVVAGFTTTVNLTYNQSIDTPASCFAQCGIGINNLTPVQQLGLVGPSLTAVHAIASVTHQIGMGMTAFNMLEWTNNLGGSAMYRGAYSGYMQGAAFI
jgi:hypothetical protein